MFFNATNNSQLHQAKVLHKNFYILLQLHQLQKFHYETLNTVDFGTPPNPVLQFMLLQKHPPICRKCLR